MKPTDITIVPPEKSEIDILRAERDYYRELAFNLNKYTSAMLIPDSKIAELITLREAAGLL